MKKTDDKSFLKDNCIFCNIIADQTKCHKIWEDSDYLAFLSIYPNTKGLTIVIPKIHLSSYIFDHSMDVVTQLMRATKNVSKLLVCSWDDVERTAIVFEGFGVDHLHTKLFPLHGGKLGIKPEKTYNLTNLYIKYPGYISTHDSKSTANEELSYIAKKIREKSLK